jgi:hypothetical protein
MPKIDRRHPENTQLREKINRIQDMSQQLVNLVDHVQKETVAWARAGQVADLPSVALATRLSDAFEEQRVAISLIQQDIKGTNPSIEWVSTPLITDGELAALMR